MAGLLATAVHANSVFSKNLHANLVMSNKNGECRNDYGTDVTDLVTRLDVDAMYVRKPEIHVQTFLLWSVWNIHRTSLG